MVQVARLNPACMPAVARLLRRLQRQCECVADVVADMHIVTHQIGWPWATQKAQEAAVELFRRRDVVAMWLCLGAAEEFGGHVPALRWSVDMNRTNWDFVHCMAPLGALDSFHVWGILGLVGGIHEPTGCLESESLLLLISQFLVTADLKNSTRNNSGPVVARFF